MHKLAWYFDRWGRLGHSARDTHARRHHFLMAQFIYIWCGNGDTCERGYSVKKYRGSLFKKKKEIICSNGANSFLLLKTSFLKKKKINNKGRKTFQMKSILLNSWTIRKAYSKIPILRPPLGLSKSGLKGPFWTVPKVVSNQVYSGCRKMMKRIT